MISPKCDHLNIGSGGAIASTFLKVGKQIYHSMCQKKCKVCVYSDYTFFNKQENNNIRNNIRYFYNYIVQSRLFTFTTLGYDF